MSAWSCISTTTAYRLGPSWVQSRLHRGNCFSVQATMASPLNWHQGGPYKSINANRPDSSSLLSNELCSSDIYWMPSHSVKDETHPSTLAALTHRSHQGVQETCPNTGADVTNGQDEAGGHSFLFWIVRQGQVRFGHADGQIPKALGREGDRGGQMRSWHCSTEHPGITMVCDLQLVWNIYTGLTATSTPVLSYCRLKKEKESVLWGNTHTNSKSKCFVFIYITN